MKEKIERLSKFGMVLNCKIINDSIVAIVITEGFSEKFSKTCGFINECRIIFPDFPIIETCITKESLAIMILSKNK